MLHGIRVTVRSLTTERLYRYDARWIVNVCARYDRHYYCRTWPYEKTVKFLFLCILYGTFYRYYRVEHKCLMSAYFIIFRLSLRSFALPAPRPPIPHPPRITLASTFLSPHGERLDGIVATLADSTASQHRHHRVVSRARVLPHSLPLLHA